MRLVPNDLAMVLAGLGLVACAGGTPIQVTIPPTRPPTPSPTANTTIRTCTLFPESEVASVMSLAPMKFQLLDDSDPSGDGCSYTFEDDTARYGTTIGITIVRNDPVADIDAYFASLRDQAKSLSETSEDVTGSGDEAVWLPGEIPWGDSILCVRTGTTNVCIGNTDANQLYDAAARKQKALAMAQDVLGKL